MGKNIDASNRPRKRLSNSHENPYADDDCIPISLLARFAIAAFVVSLVGNSMATVGHGALFGSTETPEPEHYTSNNPSVKYYTRGKSLEQEKYDEGSPIKKCAKLSSFDSYDNQRSPPRYMSDTTNPIYFIHVGKSGGTSVDAMFRGIFKSLGEDEFTEKQKKRYIGHQHYDWSYIQQKQKEKAAKRGMADALEEDDNTENGYDVYPNADVVTFLRHPVDRAVSQFYYSRQSPWMKRSRNKALFQSLDEYLDDQDKTWFQPINDGGAGVDFLAGIFEEGWVSTDRQETEHKRYLKQNNTAAVLLAARRLEKTMWLGLMEDIPRSMKLLQLTMGLDFVPTMPKDNPSHDGHSAPSQETKDKIEKYLPKDLWLYEYAKRLFNARWDYFTGVSCTYIPPELPPLPHFDW